MVRMTDGRRVAYLAMVKRLERLDAMNIMDAVVAHDEAVAGISRLTEDSPEWNRCWSDEIDTRHVIGRLTEDGGVCA